MYVPMLPSFPIFQIKYLPIVLKSVKLQYSYKEDLENMIKNAGNLFWYYAVVPFILSFGCFFLLTVEKFGPPALLFVISVIGFFLGRRYGRREIEVSLWKKYLPVFTPVLLISLLAAIGMLISKGFFGHEIWDGFVFILFPFILNSMIAGLSGMFLYTFAVPFLYFLFFLIGFFMGEQRTANKAAIHVPVFSYGIIAVLLLLAISGGVYWDRSKHVLPPSYGFEYGNGFSSVDLTPYYVTNPNNKLPQLDHPASFLIEKQSEMPILDGAEAAYPVYAAFAKAAYKNIDKQNTLPNGTEVVSFTNTIYAFERLVSGEADIFFGAQPSAAQQRLAKNSGKELVLTPIGKEAFVFFVNEDNPVGNLTTADLQSIYSGKVTNWRDAGGRNADIIAFQRPADSGSQTIMEKFMGDTPLMPALKEEVAGMGDLMEEVASYRNYENSLGYSFRFFTTGMNPNEKIKLVSLDGVQPTAENISSGKYPYVVHLYAITVKDNPNKSIKPMLEWMQGPEGQKLVEEIGYIPLK